MPSSSNQRGPWKLVGAGIEFAGAVLVFALIGYGIDHWLGWYPWATVIGTLLGFAGGMYNLIKLAQWAQRQPNHEDRHHDAGSPDA